MERKHIEWDQEKANRLYDYASSVPTEESTYWGYVFGEAFVHLCTYLTEDNIRKLKTLDYGCGMGHIIERLIHVGVNTYGVDMSEESVNHCNKKYRNKKCFHGVRLYSGGRLPYDDDEFDLITCTECIEHILDQDLDIVLKELKRVLKPGGIVVFTTPNDENMIKNSVCCPECNTVFHRWGHVRKFTRQSLVDLMKGSFDCVVCETTNFEYIKNYLHVRSILDVSLRRTYRRILWLLAFFKDFRKPKNMNCALYLSYLSLEKKPNLFYVGKKAKNITC